MKKYPQRVNFSIVKDGSFYQIQCDDTMEIMSGRIKSKLLAKKALKDNLDTHSFIESSKNFSLEEIARRLKIFGGRLRSKKKSWTIEEARLVASVYSSRGRFLIKIRDCTSQLIKRTGLTIFVKI